MVMASGCPTTTSSSLLIFFLFSWLLTSHALANQDHGEHYPRKGLPEEHIDLQGNMQVLMPSLSIRGLNMKSPPKYARRMLIGSTAPVCTFNECRGCRFKCTAEQIPVDANDPMNSSYHYKCVCHR